MMPEAPQNKKASQLSVWEEVTISLSYSTKTSSYATDTQVYKLNYAQKDKTLYTVQLIFSISDVTTEIILDFIYNKFCALHRVH